MFLYDKINKKIILNVHLCKNADLKTIHNFSFNKKLKIFYIFYEYSVDYINTTIYYKVEHMFKINHNIYNNNNNLIKSILFNKYSFVY